MKANRILILVALSGLHFNETAQTVSPVQSAARLFRLDIAGLVQVVDFDEASRAFQKEAPPEMLKFVDSNLDEFQKLGGESPKAMALDPSELTLAFDTTARVYFVGECAMFATASVSPRRPRSAVDGC